MLEDKKLSSLVKLGERSKLKEALNKAVANLRDATDENFKPHICLNKAEGMEVFYRISRLRAAANTEIVLIPYFNLDREDAWLNVQFRVYLDQICWPKNLQLSPRQTGHIVKNLAPEFQSQVLEKVRIWYQEEFLPNTQKSIETISAQLATGDPLLESDHDNRVFDIHGGRGLDVPYTECMIIGENLYWGAARGQRLYEYGFSGYERADNMISGVAPRRREPMW